MGKRTEILDRYMPLNLAMKWVEKPRTNGEQLARAIPFIILTIVYCLVMLPTWIIFKLWEFADWCGQEAKQ